jgi:hypothetical protein
MKGVSSTETLVGLSIVSSAEVRHLNNHHSEPQCQSTAGQRRCYRKHEKRPISRVCPSSSLRDRTFQRKRRYEEIAKGALHYYQSRDPPPGVGANPGP